MRRAFPFSVLLLSAALVLAGVASAVTTDTPELPPGEPTGRTALTTEAPAGGVPGSWVETGPLGGSAGRRS